MRKDQTVLVSVLLPAYNAEKTVGRTLYNLLNQTYQHIEIIIINDGSTDSTESVIKEYKITDSRVKLFTRKNHGLIDTLNFAISKASGSLLVREDADDFSNLNRIEKQVNYMVANPDVVVCGSDYKTFGSTHNQITMSHSPEICRAEVYFFPPVSHPSTIIRKSFLTKYTLTYSEKHKHCEDYALWVDIIRHGGKITNLACVLHNYHNHENQVSVTNSRESTQNHYGLIQQQLAELSVNVSVPVLNHLHYADKSYLKELSGDIFHKVLAVYTKVYDVYSDDTKRKDGMKEVLTSLTNFKIKHAMGITGLFIVYKRKPSYYSKRTFLQIIPHAVKRTCINMLKR